MERLKISIYIFLYTVVLPEILFADMPSRCCVPGCSATCIGGAGVHLFSFPLEEVMKKKWMKAIPRRNWEPKQGTKICSAHFHEKDIKKVDVLKRADGKFFKSQEGLCIVNLI